MSNCKICGRKNQIIQVQVVKSGKQKGWKRITSRCELHENTVLFVRPPIKSE